MTEKPSELKKELEKIWQDRKCRSPLGPVLWMNEQNEYSEQETELIYWMAQKRNRKR